MSRAIDDVVWPFDPPPVTANRWSAQDWANYVHGFRPEGYAGGAYDQQAWDQWKKDLHAKQLRAFLERHGVPEEKILEAIK